MLLTFDFDNSKDGEDPQKFKISRRGRTDNQSFEQIYAQKRKSSRSNEVSLLISFDQF
jgi:hypothetical protein